MGATGVAGALRLEVVSGKAAGFEILVDERLVIGRHSDGPGRLADDPELSRHHAQISREDHGTYSIEDLASTNGTIVNGSRISSPMPLSTGDSIEVGGTVLRVADVPVAQAPVDAAPSAVDVRAATVSVQTPPEMRSAPAAAPEPAEPPNLAPEPAGLPTEPLAPFPPEELPPEPDFAQEPPLEEPPPKEPPFEEPPPKEPPSDELPLEPSAAAESTPAVPALEPDAPAPLGADVPRLALQLVVDPTRGEAEIRFDDDAVPIRLHVREGRWQVTGEET